MAKIFEHLLPYLKGNFVGQRVVVSTVFAEFINHCKVIIMYEDYIGDQCFVYKCVGSSYLKLLARQSSLATTCKLHFEQLGRPYHQVAISSRTWQHCLSRN
jgi:hypothetical protein